MPRDIGITDLHVRPRINHDRMQNGNKDDRDKAIRTRDVADLLGLAPITLVQQRQRGEGPPFFRVGRNVRYILSDVLAYRQAHRVG